jgi:outer membrane protein assembly factor BamB
MADTQNRGLWMTAIIALFGALAFVALRSPAPAPPPAAAPDGPLAPLALLEGGPLGPFAVAGSAEQAPAEWAMEGYDAGRTRFADRPLSLPLTQQRAVPMPTDRETGSPPVIAGGLMLVETRDHLRAFDLHSGRERWAFGQAGSYISPAVAGERAYLRAESANKGQLIALDLQNGEPVWRFTPRRLSSQQNGYFGGHLGSPVIADDVVFVGAGKELYALDSATGAMRWEFAAQDYVTSSATVAGGRVFISDFKFVYGIDQASGKLLWSFPSESAISFSPVAGADVVLVTRGERVVALDAATGAQRWELGVAGQKLIPAALNADTAFIKSTETLYALRLADGSEAWRFRDLNFVSLPALAGGQVFVVSGQGADSAVVALDAGSGKGVWKQAVRSLAATAPVIAGGALYVRLDDGRVLGLWS